MLLEKKLSGGKNREIEGINFHWILLKLCAKSFAFNRRRPYINFLKQENCLIEILVYKSFKN